MILDNVIDHHYIRNNETTYLKEFGSEVNTLATHYGTHLGLIKMIPYLDNFLKLFSSFSIVGESIDGMMRMDIDHPTDSNSALESIRAVNGNTLSMPLAVAATTATKDLFKTFEVFRYGEETGTAFGIYEEIRDLSGRHGRGVASEVEQGRTPYCFFLASERDTSFSSTDYQKKRLTQKQIKEMWEKLEENGALEKTRETIREHFNKGSIYLKRALDEENFKSLDGLRKEIENSLDKILANPIP